MVKPFPCDPDQKKPKKTQNLDIPDEKVYSASPNRVNLPGDDLFIASKEDVIAKMKLRRKKGYFNHPPDISKLLKTAPAKPHKAHMKSITQPKFSNQNILQFNSSINPEEFRSAVKATYPHKDRNTTKKLNYSEFKMQGLGESTITTIPSRPELEEMADDPNYQLTKILRSIGFQGIKEYQSSSIWRTQGKK